MQGISETCKRCVWKQQCGQSEPCCHFEPIDMDKLLDKENNEQLKQRHKWSTRDTIEQGNYDSCYDRE